MNTLKWRVCPKHCWEWIETSAWTCSSLCFCMRKSSLYRTSTQGTIKNTLCITLGARSSEVFYKKGVLRKFAMFTGKHLCQCLFFDKVAGLRTITLLKNRLWRRCFPVNFTKFLKTSFFIEHSWLLFLLS